MFYTESGFESGEILGGEGDGSVRWGCFEIMFLGLIVVAILIVGAAYYKMVWHLIQGHGKGC